MKRENVFRYLICLFVLIFAVVMLAACSSNDSAAEDDFADSDWDDVAADDWDDELVLEFESDDWDDDMAEGEADDGGGDWDDDEDLAEMDAPQLSVEEERAFEEIPVLLPSDSGRQLTYTVSFNLETLEFMRGVRLIWGTTGELGGHVENDSINGKSYRQPDLERSANFEIRIPNEQLAEFLMFIESEYNIVAFSRNMDDFTFAYERTADNLETLREQEQQILDELDGDEEPDVTQDDLAAVRELIRDLEESNIIIQRDVDYSDVTIRLSEVIMPVEEIEEPEVEEEPEAFGEQLQGVFDGATGSLLGVLQNLVLIIVAVLPWAISIAVIVVPIIYAVRKRRKKTSEDETRGE